MIEQQATLSGLGAEAEIRVDRWGVPHIRAKSLPDLFFAQGWNAARDRLWQIDLWRKRGLGRLAASFGPGFLAQDRAARHFLYRGDMVVEWAAYGDDAQEICTAFAAGINAYVRQTGTGERPLPPEFGLTDSRPELWRPEDVVRIRSHALTRNALSEVLRAHVLATESLEADLLRKNLEPRIAPGDAPAPLSEIPLAVLDLFRLATAPVTFSRERLEAQLAEAERWRKVDDLAGVVADAAWTGSNNWAVSGSRTVTGRPIAAGDPHRAHGLPSLRYLVHLTAPGLDVIGAGEPSMPGISMGHNGHAAFTQTIFGADQEDVYVYLTDPDTPGAYLGPDGWAEIEEVDEVFEIRGEEAQTHTLRFTCHGPVLLETADRLFAMRSVWFEPGTAAYFGGLTTMRARSVTDFREGLRRFASPSLNHIYGDQEGTIAWQPAGMIPVRRNWNGLLPARGDGSNEWDGFLPLEALPTVENPDKGFVHSANEYNLPDGFDQDETRIGYEWLEKSRAQRIEAVLSADARHTVEASRALQTDVISLPALRLMRLVEALPDSDGVAPARAVLAGWDGGMRVDSAAAALCEFWWTRHLRGAIFGRLAPRADPVLFAPGDVEAIVTALESPDARFGGDPKAARDALLAETLTAAYAGLTEELGPDPARWAWGDLHHGYFQHPLSAIDPSLDIGPLPKPGSASTVMHAAYRPTDFRVTNGASVRFVLDIGNWDASICMNAPGQSGDPASPHYADLSGPWSRGEYVPFLYSAPAVDAATDMRIRLSPVAE